MTAAALKSYTVKDLNQLAKKRGVSGYQGMKKDDLVRAILRAAKKAATQSKVASKVKKLPAAGSLVPLRPTVVTKMSPPIENAKSKPTNHETKPLVNGVKLNGLKHNGVKPTDPLPKLPEKKIEPTRPKISPLKDLAALYGEGRSVPVKDRLVAMVRGPLWLHCVWDVTPQSVQRAQAAMGQDWHSAHPVLRLRRVDTATSGASESVERDVKIHGRVKNWYIDVAEAQQNYRVELGYLASSGRFHSLARSNVVSTPAPNRGEIMDPHWNDVAENCEKIYAMSGGYAADGSTGELQELFEERLRRPMGSPLVTRYGAGAEGLIHRDRRLKVELEAELMIHGATHPDAHVTLQGEPIKVRPDGSFTVRCDFPNRRQVIPVVISTRDGAQQRTVVLAVERNTKILEPVLRDSNPNEM